MKEQIKHKFGEKLRIVRERKGLTLKAVAASAGVSESLVSQIERNRVSPSIDTLLNLAEILEIGPDYLFSDLKQKRNIDIIKREESRSIVTPQVTYRQLSILQDEVEEYSIEAFLMEIAPGCEKGSEEYGHLGKEFGYILEGEGMLTYGHEEYRLKQGDSTAFSSDMPHLLKNGGKKPLKALWVITPPRKIFGE